MDLYNHLGSPVGVQQIAKGLEKAGISGLLDGQTDLPLEDPFTDIEFALDWLEAQELYANGTHSSSVIYGYNVNMYYTIAKKAWNEGHEDNVFDYAYGTRCGFYSLALLWVDDFQQ